MEYQLQVNPLNGEGIFFLDERDVENTPNSYAWGLTAKHLKADPATGVVLRVSVPARWRASAPLIFAHALEVIVISGALTLPEETLGRWDYARFAPGTLTQPASEAGAELLLFFGGTLPMVVGVMGQVSDRPQSIVKSSDAPWVKGTAMAQAGRDDVPLDIKHYKVDTDTGARTYLVRVGAGVSIPWESHTVSEEAYILEGDYTLAECLPTGKAVGTYKAGGYFYRPPGIAHNGPESGTKAGAVMLIRTPAALTVDLVEGC